MSPQSDTWQDALTRRLRALVRTAPLHRIEATKGHRAEVLGEQDLRSIALRVLDVVIEKMGLGDGATFEDLREALRPLLLASDPALEVQSADAITDVVVLGLLNDRERRQAFSERYLAVSASGSTSKEVQFHLLRERETAEGETVVVATVEAINLYAGMLDYPVEDAQIAEEAVLHAQVQRGRIADAVRTAQRARLRSIEHEQKIVGLIETVRRDVEQVNWVEEALGLLATARAHVGERLEVERMIEKAVEDRLDRVLDESALSLVALRDVLQECIRRHVRLHKRLMEANGHYLREQERQAFRPPAAARLPDLEADVLRVAVRLETGALASLADAMLARFHAPVTPSVLRLSNLVDRLLAPRRNELEAPFEIGEVDLEALAPPPRSFSEADHAAANALLADVAWPTNLSSLLAAAVEDDLGDPVLHLLVLRALRAFEPGREGEEGFVAARAAESLNMAGFRGDDLELFRRAEAKA